jgi:DNA-binding CsgD family transcriptional regulator
MTDGIVGRAAELEVVRAFVREGGRARSLLLEGEAGVGKTTLWQAGCDAAAEAGLHVLTARPLAAETGFAFATLADLLAGTHDVFAELPEPQARALRVALLLEDSAGVPADEHAVGNGLLGVLRSLGTATPLLIAVDDIQWLDAPSARVLAFAAHRLAGEPIALLLALRLESGRKPPLDPDRSLPELSRLPVGPLAEDDLHRLLETRLGVVLPRPTLAQVWTMSAGNAFFALELARALGESTSSHIPGEPLPVPSTLQELVGARVQSLPEASREALLLAAALADPRVEVVSGALGVDARRLLEPAVDGEIAELRDGRVQFSHPLLAAAAYETATVQRRRAAHRRLAELVQSDEERARHLAAACEGPDEAVAAQLERAAHSARARGAPVVAAELAERAARLTPAERAADARRRLSDAAFWVFEAGDARRARDHLEHAFAGAKPGTERALILVRLARVRSYDDDIAAARELFLEAIPDAADEPALEAQAREGAATTSFRLRRYLAEAVEHAAAAASLAGRAGRRDLLAEALGTQAVAEAILGRDEAAATTDASLALQPETEERRAMQQPAFTAGVVEFWREDLDGARARFLALIERAAELQDESSLPYLHVMLGQVECVAGNLRAALRHTEDEIEHARQAGQETLVAYLLAVAAWAHAHAGDADATRARAAEALELAERTSGVPAWFFAVSALGQLELASGDARAAHAHLAPLVAFVREQAMCEPGATWCVVDEVEALTDLGKGDEARELLDWYEANAIRLDRDAARANASRCRGRLDATDDVRRALDLFREALDLHGRMPRPVDEGRTLLALGAAQRRAKERRAARETLERARTVLGSAGARLWAERASAELARIGGRAPSAGELTPVERRVAELVAAGRSNREVAATLYLSTRTVEGHLSRVYAKLGVHSRLELVTRLRNDPSKVA